MESVFVVKNSLLTVSNRSFLPKAPSIHSRNRVSRVCLASPSNNPYEEMSVKATDTSHAIKEKVDEGAQEASKALQGAQDKATENVELVGNKTRETVQDTKEWAKEGSQQASEAIQDIKEKAVDNVEVAQKKAGEIVDDTKERASDTKEWVTGQAKEGVEAFQNAGAKAKETVEGAWDSAKDATKKITEEN